MNKTEIKDLLRSNVKDLLRSNGVKHANLKTFVSKQKKAVRIALEKTITIASSSCTMKILEYGNRKTCK